MKGSANNVGVVVVQNDPELQGAIEAASALLHIRNFDGEAPRLRRLPRDRKEDEQVLAVWAWESSCRLRSADLSGLRSHRSPPRASRDRRSG